MKSIFINKMLAAICLLAATLTGCLKDKDFNNGSIQSAHNKNGKKIIEIGLTATTTDNFLNIALPNSNKDTSFNLIPVILSSVEPAKEDLQITLGKDDAAVDVFNSIYGTDYEVPPAQLYNIENAGNIVTIPKGSYTGYLKVKVKPADFLGKEYALAFSINNVNKPGYIISGNLKTGLAKISVKNIYEANYRAVGFFQHPTAPRNYNQDKYLSSVNANTVEMELGDLGAATTIIVKINPDNTVNITPGANAIPNTAEVPGDPVYNNTYNPATKTFKLKYAYTTSAPRVITEILTRK